MSGPYRRDLSYIQEGKYNKKKKARHDLLELK